MDDAPNRRTCTGPPNDFHHRTTCKTWGSVKNFKVRFSFSPWRPGVGGGQLGFFSAEDGVMLLGPVGNSHNPRWLFRRQIPLCVSCRTHGGIACTRRSRNDGTYWAPASTHTHTEIGVNVRFTHTATIILHEFLSHNRTFQNTCTCALRRPEIARSILLLFQ